MLHKLKTTILACVLLTTFSSVSEVVYVVGERSELNTIATAFQNLGDTVVRVNQNWEALSEAQLDAVFSGDVIWEGSIFSGLSAGVQARMIDYVNSDRGLMLTAERPCCEAKNASIQTVARTLTNDVDLLIGGLGSDLFGHNFSNSPTTILTGPNDIRGQVVQMDGPGRVQPTGGVNSNACFVTSGAARDFCSAAAWGADVLANNVGRLIVYGDINSQPGLVSQFNSEQFINMREFLLTGFSGGIDVCIANPTLSGCQAVTPVSAPSTIALLSLGLLMGGVARKRRLM